MESMNIQEKIAAQRALVENPPTFALNVMLGGERTVVEFTKLRGDEWQLIARMNPPRVGVQGDKDMDVNLDTLPADYPVAKITVDGEPVDEATWREMYALLDSFHKQNVAVGIWELNILSGVLELVAAGKAVAGQQ